MQNISPLQTSNVNGDQSANSSANENLHSPPANSDTPIKHRFEFRGQTMEYFKIWMVNTLLTIVTLTLFSAWAKVRSRRYFYGNTFLNGENFEYHAKPLSILFSRIIVVAVVVGGAVWAGENARDNALHSSLLFLLLPWAVVRGLSFNARYSSHRGVRFSFRRAYGKIYLIYLPLILAVLLLNFTPFLFAEDNENMEEWMQNSDNVALFIIIFLLSLLFIAIIAPFLSRGFHRYKASHHAWGGLPLTFKAPSFVKYMIAYWLIPIIWTIIALGVYVVPIVIIADLSDDTTILYVSQNPLLSLIYAALFYSTLVLIWMHTRAILFHLFWNGVQTKEGQAMRCDFSPLAFAFKILTVNMLAIVLSLGLLYPWAKIRKSRYLAEHMTIVAPAGFLDGVVAARKERENALGEEFDTVEGFDFDVGLI